MNTQNVTSINPAPVKYPPLSSDFTVDSDTGEAFISQRKLAELINVNPSTLKKYIYGNHPKANTSKGIDDILLSSIVANYAMYSKSDNDKAKAFYAWLSKDGNSIKNYHEFSYSPNKKEKKRLNGYVYIFKIDDWYKIGKAKNVTSRLSGCQTGSPYEIEVIHTIPCEDYSLSESSLHKKYEDVRGIGEWFKLTDEQVAEITNIKKL